MSPSFTRVSPGEHRPASQDAASRLGPLRAPVSVRHHRGCNLPLPQAADGTDAASIPVPAPHLFTCFSPSLSLAL